VCQALNRHAGKLDRLDYADCVADLLHHVPEVRLECETSGMVPTVATAAARPSITGRCRCPPGRRSKRRARR
jgi:hypothetical protein